MAVLVLVSGAVLSAVPGAQSVAFRHTVCAEWLQSLWVPPGLPSGQEEQPLFGTAQFGGPCAVQTHRALNFPVH